MSTYETNAVEPDASNDNQQTDLWAYGDADEIATDGGRMPCPHRMRASMDLARRWDIDRDDARAFLVELGFLVEVER